jgi:glycine/D-amino acid oxidase-like deaminating enzyme
MYNGIFADLSDPYLLTTFLLEAAEAKGAEYIQARATNLSTEVNKVKIVHATRVDGSTISLTCNNLVIATGPWTGQLSRTLLEKTIPVTSYAGHSIIVRPITATSEDCLFLALSTKKSSYHPEIFPRLSGQVYICGVNDTLPLPESPDAATPRPRDMDKLRDIASSILEDYTVDAEQLCFRPMTEHGEPFVSAVPGAEGVWVGAGHSFWGITLGPGTGRVLSEMILREDLSADIGQLSLCNTR